MTAHRPISMMVVFYKQWGTVNLMMTTSTEVGQVA